jgi:hypothetical protein
VPLPSPRSQTSRRCCRAPSRPRSPDRASRARVTCQAHGELSAGDRPR